MIFGKYHFFCRLQSATILPYYKGSTFRGVFGNALKMVVCALKRQECPDCLLRERCLYPLVFETPPGSTGKAPSRIAAPPHPFVIEPPLSTDTLFKAGDSFDFQFLLFGEVNQNLPYFIYAFDQVGKLGIGKRVEGKRGQFALERVESSGRVIYSGHDNKLRLGDSFDTLTLRKPEWPSGTRLRLKLILLTPLRLKFQNRLKAELPFHVLVRAMLRRVSSLMDFYGEGEPPLDYKGLVRGAEAVQVLNSDLRWFDWERYSGRQDQEMLMGGMVGWVTYEGEIGPYLPLLEFCEHSHLGKQTSFGLGKIRSELVK